MRRSLGLDEIFDVAARATEAIGGSDNLDAVVLEDLITVPVATLT